MLGDTRTLHIVGPGGLSGATVAQLAQLIAAGSAEKTRSSI
ncbi:MAG TPA: hypothetical protein VJT31_20920 [Rugosimonospora sp.]|nr:hypothetical protein [Rugosimonospora sp.]